MGVFVRYGACASYFIVAIFVSACVMLSASLAAAQERSLPSLFSFEPEQVSHSKQAADRGARLCKKSRKREGAICPLTLQAKKRYACCKNTDIKLVLTKETPKSPSLPYLLYAGINEEPVIKGEQFKLQLGTKYKFTALPTDSQTLDKNTIISRYEILRDNGSTAGFASFRSVLKKKKLQIEGTVSTPQRTFLISSFEGSSRIYSIDPDALKFNHCGYVGGPIEPEKVPDPEPQMQSLQLSAQANLSTSVDLLVYYTQTAREQAEYAHNAGIPGQLLIRDAIQQGVADTNGALSRSGAGITLNLIGMREIPRSIYPAEEEGITTTEELSDMSISTGRLSFVSTDRNTLNADLVSLIVESAPDLPNGGGRAYVFDGNQAKGFSVVTRKSAQFGQIMFSYTMSHEIGHTLGAGHARGDPYDYGTYSFSHGYRFTGNSGTLWRDIMAYDPGTLIPYFSSPLLSYDGRPVGAADADNVRTFQQNKNAVAAFRPIVPPIPPDNITATTLSNSEIKVTWRDRSNNEKNFEIRATGPEGEIRTNIPANATSGVLSNLSSAGTYTIRVVAIKEDSSADSSSVVASTLSRPMREPWLLSAPTFAGIVMVGWWDKTGDEQGFKIERSENNGAFSPLVTLPPNSTKYIDYPQNLGSLYTYRVWAFSGNDTSSVSTVSAQTKLVAPQGIPHLSYTQLTPHSLRLNWTNTDRSNIVDRYVIFRASSPGQYQEIGSTDANGTSFVDSNLELEKTYYYNVRTFNKVGSSPTETLEVRLRLITPGNFSLEVLGSTSIKLNWTDPNGEGEILAQRYRGACPGSPGTIVYETKTLVFPRTAPFVDTNLLPRWPYCYRIQASANYKVSEFTEWIGVVTEAEPPTPTPALPTPVPTRTPAPTPTMTPTPLPVPNNFAINLISGGMMLAWSTSYSGIIGIEKHGEGGTWRQIAEVPASPNVYYDYQPNMAARQYYRLYHSVNGVRSYTAEKSNKPLNTSALAGPASFMASVQDGSLKLTWRDNATNEEGYMLERATAGGAFALLPGILPANSISTTDTSAQSGVTYQYRLRAVTTGDSSFSVVSGQVTLPAVATPTPTATATPHFTPTPQPSPTPMATVTPPSTPTATPTIDTGPRSSWTNPRNRNDVDDDGDVDLTDYQILNDWILTTGGGPLPLRPTTIPPQPFLDVSGDGSFSPADVLRVRTLVGG